jgi:DNA-binding XRE family transcriptional regulator
MVKKRLTNEDMARVKNHAKLLFTREGVTSQKDLALRVGVSENTISKWVKDEGWEKHRASIILTKDEELRRVYMQLTELNDNIFKRPQGERFSTTKEADILVKLSATIRQLETDVALAEAIEVLIKLINLVNSENLTEGKIIIKWADIFLKTLSA